MSSLDDYSAYVAIVEEGSLTAAAKTLGRSLQAVSRSLGALEEELGVTLLARTTRRQKPTEAGLLLHARLKSALSDIALARDEAAREGRKLSGRIRVGASTQLGVSHVFPVLAAFMERHRGVEIELALDDSYVDLISGGLDLAVRVGPLPDSNLKSRRIGATRRVLFAAPHYFATHGRPKNPVDLKSHSCIGRLDSGPSEIWRFGEGEGLEEAHVRGRFRSDNAPARVAAALAGLGIASAPLFQVRALIESGKLELVLSDYERALTPVRLVWLPGKATTARVRALIDFMAARMSLASV